MSSSAVLSVLVFLQCLTSVDKCPQLSNSVYPQAAVAPPAAISEAHPVNIA